MGCCTDYPYYNKEQILETSCPAEVSKNYTTDSKHLNKMNDVLRASGLESNWVAPYVSCSESQKVGPCSNPPRYQHVNYGFLMGPVQHLKQLVQFILTDTEKLDQGLASQYYFDHPDVVTLDYAGTLVLSLHNFRKTPLEVRNIDGQKFLYNRATQ